MMKRLKKTVFGVLAGMLLLSAAGCGGNENTTEIGKSDETHVIVDHLGYEIEVPYELRWEIFYRFQVY